MSVLGIERTGDPKIDRVLDQLELRLGLLQHVTAAEGAPSHTPAGAQLYVRTDGGAGSTLYVYEPGVGWKAV